MQRLFEKTRSCFLAQNLQDNFYIVVCLVAACLCQGFALREELERSEGVAGYESAYRRWLGFCIVLLSQNVAAIFGGATWLGYTSNSLISGAHMGAALQGIISAPLLCTLKSEYIII